MNILPEFFVSLCFVQCGAWLSFMIFISREHYSYVLVGPQICAMVTAGAAGIILALAKHIYGRVRFIHPALMGLGTLGLFGCGVAFVVNYEDPTVGLFFGGLGHGMVFISGLCYVHFRSKDDGYRVFRTGFCHLAHLGGFTLVAHLTAPYLDLNSNNVVYRAGWIILTGSILAICALLFNQLLHSCGLFNYRSSRDPAVENANDVSDHFKSTLGFNETLTKEPNTTRQTLLSLLALTTKLTNLTFNYHVFLYFTAITIHYLLRDNDFFQHHGLHYLKYYFGLLGLIVGLIASLFLNYKLIYMKSLGATFLAFIIGTSLFTTEHPGMAGISFWLMYFSLGVGLFIPDIQIMEVSNMRLTELMLAKGYIIENTVVCTILFLFHRHPYMLFRGGIEAIGWTHGGTFAGLFLLLLILYIIYFPSTFRKGLITIQYLVLYDQEEKPVVPAKHPTTEIAMPMPISS
ncbi:hypothetical protein DMENIID0001_002320 [Sergentomyia squamirostris]